MASVVIDLGATSGRVVLGKYTEDGIQMSEIHRFQNNIIKVNGRSYWDLLGLWHEILTGLRKASASGEKIESVGPEIGEAFDQVDMLNKAALIYEASRNMGFVPEGMSDEQMNELKEAFNL